MVSSQRYAYNLSYRLEVGQGLNKYWSQKTCMEWWRVLKTVQRNNYFCKVIYLPKDPPVASPESPMMIWLLSDYPIISLISSNIYIKILNWILMPDFLVRFSFSDTLLLNFKDVLQNISKTDLFVVSRGFWGGRF